MSEVKSEPVVVDPFTTKRIHEFIREKHFENSALYKDLCEEFGRRIGYAVKEGLPMEIAFESCREHFRIVGKSMIDIANEVSLEMVTGRVTDE